MIERQQRIKEVYEYLRAHRGIHTQEDFANSLHKSRNAITLALNGNEKYLTINLFKSICKAYPETFNLDYLLTGEGTLLSMSEKAPEQKEKADTPPTDEMSANILELYARMIRGVDDLRLQLKEQLAEVHTIRAELQQARDDFRDATHRLNQALERLNNSDNTRIGIAADDI